MGDYGLKVSKAGYSVLTGADKDMAFTSKGSSPKILSKGSTTISLPADYSPDLFGNTSKDIAHGLSYAPGFLVYGTLSTTAGRYYMPNIISVPSDTDYHHFWAWTDATNLRIVMGKNFQSSHWGGSGCTHTIYYYILADPAS